MKLQTYHQTRLAVGSDCTLCLVTAEPEARVNDLFSRLWTIIFQFERQFSRFIPDSELSAFNRSAGLKITITPEFRDLLRTAKHLSEITDGLYNPFILPALQRAGYTQSHVEQFKNDVQESYAERSVVSVTNLIIDDSTAEIPYGTALDLGGCGKGYLADLLADADLPDWLVGYWFSIGGDVTGQGLDANGQPWTIAVADEPGLTSDQSWHIQATDKRFAAATSGTRLRRGVHGGKNWHHIIDPRTLQPAVSDCYMATIYGQSAVEADVLASCAIILGSTASQDFLRRHHVKASLLQCSAPDRGDFVVQSGKAIQLDDPTVVPYNQ